MKEIHINIINESNNPLPEYKTEGSSGMDIAAYIPSGDPIYISPGEIKLIHTGLYFGLPEGIELQLRSRSGLTLKNGVVVANGIATIDSDYTGEVMVILINLGSYPFTVKSGDRIAQGVFMKYEKAKFKIVESLETTERGSGGFGHTGI